MFEIKEKYDTTPRIDVLILSSVARAPMHGYELKLELRYRHVEWWAKAEHGHLYAALKRLEKKRLIRGRNRRDGNRPRRVYSITERGRQWVEAAIESLAVAPDATYFDVDLFIAGSYLLDRDRALAIFEERLRVIGAQRREAEALRERVAPNVPLAAQLIMSHRIEHLKRELDFAQKCLETIASAPSWGAYLGSESIESFVERTGASLES